MKLLHIGAIGYVVLVGALLLNAIAAQLQIMTWYDFIKTPRQAGVLDLIWLFGAYPAALGVLAYYAVRLGALTN